MEILRPRFRRFYQSFRNDDNGLLDRLLIGLWLAGPFIYLIERTPADIWLSLFGLIFLGRSVVSKDWGWLKINWMKWAGCFIAVLVISACFSQRPLAFLGEALAWCRFPLYAAAAQYWLARRAYVVEMLFFLTFCGALILTACLAAEILWDLESWINFESRRGRLTWPFGDQVPGNYLSKFCLPALICLVLGISQKLDRKMLFSLLMISYFLTWSMLIGERINTIILMSSILLAVVCSRAFNVKSGLMVLGTVCAAVLSIMLLSDTVFIKYAGTAGQLLDLTNSGYGNLWQTGLSIFTQAPVLGIGPGGFRDLCPTIEFPTAFVVRCDNHPHNYYVQALAETGILGFIALSGMVVSLVVHLWNRRNSSGASPAVGIMFIIPLALFFPIQSTADLFGQWVNVMSWYAIGLALALSHKDNGISKGDQQLSKV